MICVDLKEELKEDEHLLTLTPHKQLSSISFSQDNSHLDFTYLMNEEGKSLSTNIING
jgi:hypothetical protein